ncbi:MAG: response regulator [Actinomycetota bacterium]
MTDPFQRSWRGPVTTSGDLLRSPEPLFSSSTVGADAAEPLALRVLVVDDNDGFRESLVALLATGGHQIAGEATNGREALEMIEALDPDVVLMDIRMPVMDGIEATRRLKASRPLLGVVALTAQEDDTIVREMLVAGASGYVLKDSDGDVILNAITEAAGGGAVLSPTVTPRVIEQLTEALERERHRARELEEAHLALVERVSRRHELVARLGHELRTPVTVMLGIARTLGGEGVDDRQRRELLDRLVSRGTGLARLVERFESALDTGSEDRFDLPALAREVAATFLDVVVSAQHDLPDVFANRVLARRIMEELIDNARKFSPDGTPVRVRISAGAGVLETRVTDAGRGIPPGDRDRVFEPLEQGEALDARTHQGAGVGLSLGRAAARAMDGDVVLERSGPDGSTFLWTLALGPRAESEVR